MIDFRTIFNFDKKKYGHRLGGRTKGQKQKKNGEAFSVQENGLETCKRVFGLSSSMGRKEGFKKGKRKKWGIPERERGD